MQQAGWKISTSRKHWWAPVTTDRNHMTALNVDPAVRGSCKPSQKKNTSQKKTESNFWMNVWLLCDWMNECWIKTKLGPFPWMLGSFHIIFFFGLRVENLQPRFVLSAWSQALNPTCAYTASLEKLPNCSTAWHLKHLLIEKINKAHGCLH